MVITLPRSSPGSGPVVVETERGGVVESSLTFSYVPTDDSTGGGGGGSTNAGGGVVGGAGRLSSFSGAILGGMTESPLLSNKRAKQSGESMAHSTYLCTCTCIHTCNYRRSRNFCRQKFLSTTFSDKN